MSKLESMNEELLKKVQETASSSQSNYSLLSQVMELQMQLKNATSLLGARIIKDDDKKTCFYTGLPTYKVFYGIFTLLEPIVTSNSRLKSRLLLVDELFMVLMKLRLGITNEDIAY